MSENTKKTHEQPNNPFMNWPTGMTESFRDLLALQTKAAQTLLDRSMALSQSFTDHVHTQMNESMKLTQECLKYGRSFTETMNKTAFEFTERTLRNPGF